MEHLGERRNVTETGFRRLLIVAAVMAATLMQTLDSTIVNVALPNIQGSLGANQDDGTWVVTAYAISALIIIPLTPWFAQRFGRKRYFVASIVGFTLASVACGLAPNFMLLVVGRVVQGLFGGGLLATAQAILVDTYPPKQIGASQAIFALGAIMGPTLGPPLGGILVDNYSWNWVFLVNLAPGLFSTAVLLLLLRDPEEPQRVPVDVLGIALLSIGLASMQYFLTEGFQHYWFASADITLSFLGWIGGLVAFVFWELYGTARPVVHLRLFQNRSVSTGSVLAMAIGITLLGSTYVLPQLTQGPLRFTATLSGYLFILRALPIALLTPLVGRFVRRIDARIFLGVGFVLIGLGSLMQGAITTPQTDFWSFALALITAGAGTALLFVPLSVAVLGAVTPKDGGEATSFINLSMQLGGAISIAVLNILVDQREQFHSSVIGASVSIGRLTVRSFLASGGSIAILARIVASQATILSYADAAIAIGVISLALTPLVFLMRRPRAAAPRSTDIEPAAQSPTE